MKTNLAPWGDAEKAAWFEEQTVKRSYQEEVVSKIEDLRSRFSVVQYGALSLAPKTYPLFLLRSKDFSPSKKTVLITGGVHGYETSGVHGALAFLRNHAQKFEARFNFLCAPCISPWGYETVNRWNHRAIDPNRSFYPDSPAEECRFFLSAVSGEAFWVHFDLHETTDTDNTVFRPALASRDGKVEEFSEIPDGFYVVADANNPQLEFQRAVIRAVKEVTHIALPDEKGCLIGAPVVDEGVIYYDMKKLFLCGGFSGAEFSTTTEVYPDSPRVTPEQCNEAQVAAIAGGLDFVAKNLQPLFLTSKN